MTRIAEVFPKLRTPNNFVRYMSEKPSFRSPFNKRHSKRSQTLSKSAQQHHFHIYWSLLRQLSWKNFLLVICKILGLFLNTLTANDKYSLLNGENLT